MGAARGQRPCKGPCASFPTRQFPLPLFLSPSLSASWKILAIAIGASRADRNLPCIPQTPEEFPFRNSPQHHRLGVASIRTNGRNKRLVTRLSDTFLKSLLLLLALSASSGFAEEALSEAAPEPAKLRTVTTEAFERYLHLTEARNESELRRGTSLLWIDALPEVERATAYEALKRGEVKMQKLSTLEDGQTIKCPGGMIHHWVGLIFIPGVKLDNVLAVLQDYDHHSVYYAPDVERSKTESRDGDHFRAFLRFRRHKVITVVLNTNHDVRYFRDAPDRAHSRSSAVRIAEVENAGRSDEREKTPGDDGGFLWRMETWWRMQARDGGVYVQSEVASLTRDIPTGLGWLIGPFVTSIPRESLTFTLQATRKAVEAHRPKDVAGKDN